VKLLLDTCTLLWLTLDADELSDTAREFLVAPSSEFVVSSASVWELAVKHPWAACASTARSTSG